MSNQDGVVQNVSATAGFAYGVIGADMHVLGDGSPLYVLENYRRAPVGDRDWLRELPSRMLSSRFAVVKFVGRRREQDDLLQWCRERAHLSARWLHAPGGQGKTRLANQIAETLIGEGWKVITAASGSGGVLPPPGSQDMRLEGFPGLLLIIDYADRWSLSYLTWLFSNSLLHQTSIPVRVLLLARTAYAWPVLRHELTKYQASMSQQFLEPLPDEPAERLATFIAARDSFADYYGHPDPTLIAPPEHLERQEWGLTLSVHMAALVAVDASVHNRRQPSEVVGLSSYLLDRERSYWTQLWNNRAKFEVSKYGVDFQTPPSVMNHAVFAAVLTGPLNSALGKALLDELDLELPSDRVITDHMACYPSVDPEADTVLEPLYPDRLAEDFIGVTMPGNGTEQPAYAWASPTVRTLLGDNGVKAQAGYVPRTITFLAAATERWPHVGERYLYPLLREQPQLAVQAGSAGLVALAGLPWVAMDVLELIKPLLPTRRDTDLAVGRAVLTERLAQAKLEVIADPVQRAQIYEELGRAVRAAGFRDKERIATGEALKLYRMLARADPSQFIQALAIALDAHATTLVGTDRGLEGVELQREAVKLYRAMCSVQPQLFSNELARVSTNLGNTLLRMHNIDEALKVQQEAVTIRRGLKNVDFGSADYLGLAHSMVQVSVTLLIAGRHDEALTSINEALHIFHESARISSHSVELGAMAHALEIKGRILIFKEGWSEARSALNEAIDILRPLNSINPGAHQGLLSQSLSELGVCLLNVDPKSQEGIAALRESVEIFPLPKEAHVDGNFVAMLANLGLALTSAGSAGHAITYLNEAVSRARVLAIQDPHNSDMLPRALSALVDALTATGQWAQALRIATETEELYRKLADEAPQNFLQRWQRSRQKLEEISRVCGE